jgi:uncharacterized membrane protein (TIGR02234 family)
MRPRPVCFALLFVGGGLGVVAAAQPWWRAVGAGSAGHGGTAPADTGLSVAFSGVQATAGLSQALAVVALAGTLLILVLRSRGRRVVGTILALVGAAIAVVGALRLQPSPEAVRAQVREVSLADQFALEPTVWPWIFAVAGAAVLAGAALCVVTAARWPVRVDRFERAAQTRPVSATDHVSEVWKAMDAGLDPTASEPAVTATDGLGSGAAGPPDVQHRGSNGHNGE